MLKTVAMPNYLHMYLHVGTDMFNSIVFSSIKYSLGQLGYHVFKRKYIPIYCKYRVNFLKKNIYKYRKHVMYIFRTRAENSVS